jgi:hypothetical protein
MIKTDSRERTLNYLRALDPHEVLAIAPGIAPILVCGFKADIVGVSLVEEWDRWRDAGIELGSAEDAMAIFRRLEDPLVPCSECGKSRVNLGNRVVVTVEQGIQALPLCGYCCMGYDAFYEDAEWDRPEVVSPRKALLQ